MENSLSTGSLYFRASVSLHSITFWVAPWDMIASSFAEVFAWGLLVFYLCMPQIWTVPKHHPWCSLYWSNLVKSRLCTYHHVFAKCAKTQQTVRLSVLSSAGVEEQQHSSVLLSRKSESWGGSCSLRGCTSNDNLLIETSVWIDFLKKNKDLYKWTEPEITSINQNV